MKINHILLWRGVRGLCSLLIFTAGAVHAQDTFGSSGNEFTIDFVGVGNAGNADDAGAGGGTSSSPHGGVGYAYRISTYEISQSNIDNATSSGLSNVSAGAHEGNQPAGDISWYEAAAFVNWMNTSNGHQAAYDLTHTSEWSMTAWGVSEQASTGVESGSNPYRHKDAFYFLPSEDEWYKAAFHKNDGVTANYWDYATGSNTAPTPVSSGTDSGTAVFDNQPDVAEVNLSGGLSPYGTMGQSGNIREWNESAFDELNDTTDELRSIRGGHWLDNEFGLSSSGKSGYDPTTDSFLNGFRVASIPEPSAFVMLLIALGAAALVLRKRFSF